MERFAVTARQVIIAWGKPLLSERPRLSNEQRRALQAEDNRFIGFFVAGAPIYLTANISSAATRKGVCNGASATLHSLTFDDATLPGVLEEITIQLNSPTCGAGSVIWISHQPSSVNVVMPTARLQPTESLLPEQQVIPLLPLRGANHTVLIDGTTCSVCPREFGYELGFAVTFHKVQGKTLSKVLINFNKMPSPPHITFEFAYVALTRVRRGSDVRVLPSSALDHMLQLRADDDVQRWLGAFDDEGVWRRNLLQPSPASTSTQRKRGR